MNSKKNIIRDLRNAISTGEYIPGERLTEVALAHRFLVSRTPVREALNQLEKEGFIKITPGMGAKVVKLSRKNVSDIYDLLIIFEGLASRQATHKLTPAQICKLEEYHLMLTEAVARKNRDLISELNARFHWFITEASENSYLIDLQINFRNLVEQFVPIFAQIAMQWEATIKEHQQIIDAFKKSNPTLAEFMTKEHLEGAKNRLLKYFENQNGHNGKGRVAQKRPTKRPLQAIS